MYKAASVFAPHPLRPRYTPYLLISRFYFHIMYVALMSPAEKSHFNGSKEILAKYCSPCFYTYNI